MWAAFLVGFLGSLHCVGMCGPLALIIHQQSARSGRSTRAGMVLYHVGRITTYVALGILIGLVSTAMWGSMQFYLAHLAGLVLIISAFSLVPWERQIWNLPGFRTLGQAIPRWYNRFLNLDTPLAPLLGGLVNGFLPCGLVYLALSMALVTGDTWLSAGMMLFFGMGTIPALAVTQYVGWKSRPRLAFIRKYVLPSFLLLTGVFLILRAWSVPIPVDLRLLMEMTRIPMCHE